MALDIKVRAKNMSTVLRVIGRVVGVDGERFAKKLESVSQKGGSILVDLSETDFLDSHGLGSIVYYFHTLQKENRDFTIRNANPDPNAYITRLFEVTNLDKILKIVKSSPDM
jgi:anti-anti-sigma factor